MIKRATLLGAALLALAVFTLLKSDTPSSFRAFASAPASRTGGERFLTLPFNDPRIIVSQGWIYDWGSEHRGIDYMLGDRNTTNWQSFDVVAAADGWACGNCTWRQGNAVWIRHVVNGLVYYTYYGHLATMEPNIPIGNQQSTVWVQRGQKIGVSGNTGADVIHLHFQVNFDQVPVDPYDLWTTRESYSPGCQACTIGESFLWTSNPPSLASGGPPPAPPSPTQPKAPPPPPTPPPAPTATPTPSKPACTVEYGQSVEGTIRENALETKYCLTAAQGDWVSIRMFAVNGAALDTYIKLYGPDGKVIAVDDDGAQIRGNSFMVQQLAQAGTYQIGATRYAGTGQYRLRIDKGAKSALGDLNSDCVVDQVDLTLLSSALGGKDMTLDLDLDGVVGEKDENTLIYRLGRGCMKIK